MKAGADDWLVGLGVWFLLRVQEVPGSSPGQARFFFPLFQLSFSFFPPVSCYLRWRIHKLADVLCRKAVSWVRGVRRTFFFSQLSWAGVNIFCLQQAKIKPHSYVLHLLICLLTDILPISYRMLADRRISPDHQSSKGEARCSARWAKRFVSCTYG